MKKYEHTELITDCTLSELNEYGSKGWHIVEKVKRNGIEVFILEREVTREKKASESIKISARQTTFASKVLVYNQYSGYLTAFIDYWTEHGEKDRKMRFEKEKSFDIERRLKTWVRNSNNFNNKPATDKVKQLNEM